MAIKSGWKGTAAYILNVLYRFAYLLILNYCVDLSSKCSLKLLINWPSWMTVRSDLCIEMVLSALVTMLLKGFVSVLRDDTFFLLWYNKFLFCKSYELMSMIFNFSCVIYKQIGSFW